MNNQNITHKSVLTPSRERTLRLMGEVSGTVLVIHDTTELDYSGLSIPELGQIGNGNGRGYLTHNALAVVAETRDVIGLAYQKLAKRPKAAKKETRQERRERPDRCITLENWEKTKLHDFARGLPAAWKKTVEVQATAKQPSRRATVSIAWADVTLPVPRQPRGEIRGVPLRTWVICVREIDPPAGVAEPLEWILLTNVPVRTLEDALERIAWYECRWIVEEYHKAMKTGADVESLQFTSEAALQPTSSTQPPSRLGLVACDLRNL